MKQIPIDKKIILFDGFCNLCDSSVQKIIKHDTKDAFRFVALQSDLGFKIIKHLGIDTKKMDSIILYQPGYAYYHKSQAVFEIAKELGGVFYLSTLFSILPTTLTDSIYDYISKNRYKWYGKMETCMTPSKELQFKFLE